MKGRLLNNLESNSFMRITGPRSGQGRVEISHHGVWGTICDDHWDLKDATVACNALGFPGALITLQGKQVQDGHGPKYFEDLECAGNENSLYDCKRSGSSYFCFEQTREGAGVICNTGIYSIVTC